MLITRLLTPLLATGILLSAPLSALAIAVYSSSGPNAASIQGSVNGFRSDPPGNQLGWGACRIL